MRKTESEKPDEPTEAQLIRAKLWGWVYCGDGYFLRENKITGKEITGYFKNRNWQVIL